MWTIDFSDLGNEFLCSLNAHEIVFILFSIPYVLSLVYIFVSHYSCSQCFAQLINPEHIHHLVDLNPSFLLLLVYLSYLLDNYVSIYYYLLLNNGTTDTNYTGDYRRNPANTFAFNPTNKTAKLKARS